MLPRKSLKPKRLRVRRMTEKDLKKLGRAQLLELMLAQSKEIDRLAEVLEES